MTKTVAQYLLSANIKRIITSPIRRCVDTADIVGGILDIAYIRDERLVECDHGDCEGLTIDEARKKYAIEFAIRDKNKWSVPWTNGESYADVYERAKSFYDSYGAHEDILVVSHETFIRCLIGYSLNWTREDIIAFRQPNSTICRVDTTHKLLRIDISDVMR
jgi:probable phosphoglycerate mutase